MNRHLAVHRPLLLASAALGAVLVLVTWPAGLSANLVAKDAPRPSAAKVTVASPVTAAPAKTKAADVALRPQTGTPDPATAVTSVSTMRTMCADTDTGAPLFTICDPNDFKATYCDDGSYVVTLCAEGPTHGTICSRSPTGKTATLCESDDDSVEPSIMPTICSPANRIPTSCPGQVLPTICSDGPSMETVCENAPGGVQPTLCNGVETPTTCRGGTMLHTICAAGPTRATFCSNAPNDIQPTMCVSGVRPTFCQDLVVPTICTNGPNQPTVCPNGETYTICIAATPSLPTACPPVPDDDEGSLHR